MKRSMSSMSKVASKSRSNSQAMFEALEDRQMYSVAILLHAPTITLSQVQADLAISKEYTATGGEKDAYGTNVKTLLGAATSGVVAVPGILGAYEETFDDNGAIIWSAKTGAHVVYGAIGAKYFSTNGPLLLGLPTTDEKTAPDGVGRYNHFESTNGKLVGAIDWTAATGAHAVQGNVALEFEKWGWEKFGEVTTDEIDITNSNYTGEYNRTAKFAVKNGAEVPFDQSAVDWSSTFGGAAANATGYTDVTQGFAGTCWIDASIAALEISGVDLTNRITYEGNDTYNVQLYNYNTPGKPSAGTHVENESVYFNGNVYSADAGYNPNLPSSSWVLIMQRAVIQALHDFDPSQNIITPHTGGAGDAQTILTGKAYSFLNTTGTGVATSIQQALNSGKSIVLNTLATTNTLVAGHDYAVFSASSTGIVLYNPYGLSLASSNPGGTDPFFVSWAVVAQDGSVFSDV
jgi:hypothetical protein